MSDQTLGAITLLNPDVGFQAAQGTSAARGTKKQVDKLTEIPEPPAVKTAPVPDSEQARKDAERYLARKYGKAGRAATILTDNSTLG